MDNIQQKLHLIMEGTILNEGDVVGFNSHHLREKKYQDEINKRQTELNNFVDSLAQTIASLSRRKDSGAMSNEMYLQKMGELESRRMTLIEYNNKLQELKKELSEIQQSRSSQ